MTFEGTGSSINYTIPVAFSLQIDMVVHGNTPVKKDVVSVLEKSNSTVVCILYPYSLL